MATRKVILTNTPTKISEGTEGIRMQSKYQDFCWAAGTTAPKDLTLCMEDRDVYVEGKGPIWAWKLSKAPLAIMVV